MSVYTDGGGNYYAPGNITALDSTKQDVNLRNQVCYTTIQMLVTDVEARLGGGWTVAPGLSDIGGGVWVNGLLVDGV